MRSQLLINLFRCDVVADLTDREWEFLDAIKAHRTPEDIRREWGVSRSYVGNLTRALEAKGVIQRRDGVPPFTRYTQEYPWVPVDDIEVRYKPAVPPDATFKVKYPLTSRRDMTVQPIRFLQWAAVGVTVQGIPVCRPDDLEPYSGGPEHRVVWITTVEGPGWVFVTELVPLWHESWTGNNLTRRGDKQGKRVRARLLGEHRVGVTQLIAAAIGAKPVFDVT